jgi:hypothetical protein
MAQAKNAAPKTMQVIVDRPFYLPVYDMEGGVPTKTGVRVAAVDELVTLETELARDVIASKKATALDADAEAAKAQIADAKARTVARERAAAAAEKAAAAAMARAGLDPTEALKAELPGLIAAAVAQALVQAGIGKAG